jgi:hypothetical protein
LPPPPPPLGKDISTADEIRRATIYMQLQAANEKLCQSITSDHARLLQFYQREKFIRESFAAQLVIRDKKTAEQRQLLKEMRDALVVGQKEFHDMKQAVQTQLHTYEQLEQERQRLVSEEERFKQDRLKYFADLGIPIGDYDALKSIVS